MFLFSKTMYQVILLHHFLMLCLGFGTAQASDKTLEALQRQGVMTQKKEAQDLRVLTGRFKKDPEGLSKELDTQTLLKIQKELNREKEKESKRAMGQLEKRQQKLIQDQNFLHQRALEHDISLQQASKAARLRAETTRSLKVKQVADQLEQLNACDCK
jgi:hypothetical protein